jgi:hypothetical protein
MSLAQWNKKYSSKKDTVVIDESFVDGSFEHSRVAAPTGAKKVKFESAYTTPTAKRKKMKQNMLKKKMEGVTLGKFKKKKDKSIVIKNIRTAKKSTKIEKRAKLKLFFEKDAERAKSAQKKRAVYKQNFKEELKEKRR